MDHEVGMGEAGNPAGAGTPARGGMRQENGPKPPGRIPARRPENPPEQVGTGSPKGQKTETGRDVRLRYKNPEQPPY